MVKKVIMQEFNDFFHENGYIFPNRSVLRKMFAYDILYDKEFVSISDNMGNYICEGDKKRIFSGNYSNVLSFSEVVSCYDFLSFIGRRISSSYSLKKRL